MGSILSISYKGGSAVAQSDTVNDVNGPFQALEATTASGLVKVTTQDGSVLTVYLTQGLIKPLYVVRVWSSVTTATAIVGYRAASPEI